METSVDTAGGRQWYRWEINKSKIHEKEPVKASVHHGRPTADVSCGVFTISVGDRKLELTALPQRLAGNFIVRKVPIKGVE